jgi:hypothetical protein
MATENKVEAALKEHKVDAWDLMNRGMWAMFCTAVIGCVAAAAVQGFRRDPNAPTDVHYHYDNPRQ